MFAKLIWCFAYPTTGIAVIDTSYEEDCLSGNYALWWWKWIKGTRVGHAKLLKVERSLEPRWMWRKRNTELTQVNTGRGLPWMLHGKWTSFELSIFNSITDFWLVCGAMLFGTSVGTKQNCLVNIQRAQNRLYDISKVFGLWHYVKRDPKNGISVSNHDRIWQKWFSNVSRRQLIKRLSGKVKYLRSCQLKHDLFRSDLWAFHWVFDSKWSILHVFPKSDTCTCFLHCAYCQMSPTWFVLILFRRTITKVHIKVPQDQIRAVRSEIKIK